MIYPCMAQTVLVFCHIIYRPMPCKALNIAIMPNFVDSNMNVLNLVYGLASWAKYQICTRCLYLARKL